MKTAIPDGLFKVLESGEKSFEYQKGLLSLNIISWVQIQFRNYINQLRILLLEKGNIYNDYYLQNIVSEIFTNTKTKE